MPGAAPRGSVAVRPARRRARTERVAVAVVGGGLTGLVLAHHLQRRGVEYRVLEASPTPGGVVRTLRREGRLLDLGPQRIRLTPEILGVIGALGLEPELIRAPEGLPLWIVRDGRLRQVPYSAMETARGDLFSLRGKLRLLLEPFTGGARRDETVGAFLRRKFGDEGYRYLMGPLFGGLYASDPDRMLVRHALDGLLRSMGERRSLLVSLWEQASGVRSTVPAGSFRQGMAELPLALAAAAGDRLRTGCVVTGLDRAPGRGYRLEGHFGRVDADRVVLTVPADAAGGLLRELAPDAAERLSHLRYNRLAAVYLESDCALRGLGFKVAFGEALRLRGVTFNDSLFGRRGLFTAYLGGMEDPGVLELDDDRLGALAAEGFEQVTGHAARVLHVHRTRIPAWDRTWVALDDLQLPYGIDLASSFSSRPGVPVRFKQAREVADRLAVEV